MSTFEPSDRGRKGAITFLATLIDNPPDGFEGLIVEKARKGTSQQQGDDIPASELTEAENPADLFEDHLERYEEYGSNLRYRMRVRQADGKLLDNAPTKTWGLKRASTDAMAARTAGSGSAVATAAMGRSTAEGFSQVVAMMPELARQAAGQSGEQYAAVLEMQTARHAEMIEMVLTNSQMQIELVNGKWEAELNARGGFLETEAGAQIASAALQAVVPVVVAGGHWISAKAQAMSLGNRRLELQLRAQEIELEERSRLLQPSPPEPTASPSDGGGGTAGVGGEPPADPDPGEEPPSVGPAPDEDPRG